MTSALRSSSLVGAVLTMLVSSGFAQVGDTTPPVIICPADSTVPGFYADGFDGSTLDASWTLHNASLLQFSVSGGELHMRPTAGGLAAIWYQDGEGPAILRTVTGDFTATTTIRAEDSNNPGQPPRPQFRLGGLIARDPAGVPGNRNSVHVVLGAGPDSTPIAVEDKTTDGSNSNFVTYPIAQASGTVRIVRTGSVFSLEYRALGASSFQVLRVHNRPDLPATLEVGPMVYSYQSPPNLVAHFDEFTITNTEAVVSFPAPTVVDDTDPAPTVVVSPPSGSSFPVGTTTVLCTATDASGNSATCSFAVTVTTLPVGALPVANFLGAPTSGVVPLTVSFSDQSGGLVNAWAWDFGDGGTSMARNPAHAYTTPGTYTVRLTATGPGGADTLTRLGYVIASDAFPVAGFSGAPRTGYAPLTADFVDGSTGNIASRLWNFGDGGTSTARDPSHTYASPGTYTVSLTVTGPGGSDTETLVDFIVVGNAPPVANFIGAPTSGSVPLTVSFSDQSGGLVNAWAWNFGDGGTSTAQHPVRTYATAGTYTVRLTVTGPGGSDTETQVGYVVAVDAAPVAAFTGTPQGGNAPLLVAFTDLSTGPSTTWAWDFGDGNTSSIQNPSHTYTAVGNYTVGLTVTGPGGSDTVTRVDFIVAGNAPPVANFIGAPANGIVPLTVSFSDQSGGLVNTWAWNFGDGGTSTAQHPVRTYMTTGTYTVRLTVTGPGGSDTETLAGYIVVADAAPVADFTGSPQGGNAPLLVAFTDLSTGPATSWAWDYGDGDTSSVQNPSHTYTTAGNYTVSLTVVGPGGTRTETRPAYVMVATAVGDTTPPMITCPADSTVPGFFADGFDGSTLDPSWRLHNASLLQFSVSGGELHMRPTAGGLAAIWYRDGEGPAILRTVTGDFTATTTIRAEDPNNPGQPPRPQFRLGGLIARDPAGVPGNRNSVHVVLGAGPNSTPIAVEDKTTDGSNSNFVTYPIAQASGTLRIVRTGSVFSLEYRALGASSFQVLRVHNRPDLPATLEVGPMVYSYQSPPNLVAHFDEFTITNTEAVVSFPAPTVVDDTDPAPTVVVSPPSGSSFPVGTTMVLCTATDASGNSATCSFAVTVTTQFGLTRRDPVTTLAFPAAGAPAAAFAVARAFPGLSFAAPSFLTHAGDGTDRIFVCELGGTIRVFDNDEAQTTSSLFLDIRGRVVTGGERGLLGLAFDPDYANNGFFYVHYSGSSGGATGVDHRTFLSRFQVSSGDPNVADPGSETVLLNVDQPFSNHNGGSLAFGPDDMLYVSLGDGGGGDDPDAAGQDLTSLRGKILRLTPAGGIPADNPFVGQTGGVRQEIWAYGLRNPWRMSFDRNNGNLWVADVGENAIEEIDLIVRGGNYGWDVFEGSLAHENPGGLIPLSSTIEPVHQYSHGQGRSITGGYVYRGTASPSLVGSYVYADYISGRIWALSYDGVQVVSNLQVGSQTDVASFGEDQAGELYLCSLDGNLYRLEESGGGTAPQFPQLLSETGLFTETANLVPATGVIEYGVNTPLWSDGARKRRWIALPGTESIVFDPTQPWSFPMETVFVKHFEMETTPGVFLRLETRVLIQEVAGWQGYTYRWNVQQDDATLLAGADTLTFTVQDPGAPGGQRQQTWDFPSRTDCLGCHTNAAGHVLGARTLQLNGDFPYSTATDNQLRSWNHVGLFTADIGTHGAYPALPSLEDDTIAPDLRARAYMDVNCAQCHRPSGSTPVDIDLRWEVLSAQTRTVSVLPNTGDLGLSNPFLVAPGSKETSVLWERMRRLDANRMPPVGSNEVDAEGVGVVGQWIDDGAD